MATAQIQTSGASSPAATSELRHMMSNGGLQATSGKDSRRVSQHLQPTPARQGSRSPTSIPSSPTSIHSSSSAIFERDIEPIASPSMMVSSSPPVHPSDPHRTARSKATEQLEQSVPSVLDSAAEILTGIHDGSEQIAIVAPVPHSPTMFNDPPEASYMGAYSGSPRSTAIHGSGFASPASAHSRSPSPGGKSCLLLNIPSSSMVASPRQPLRSDTMDGPAIPGAFSSSPQSSHAALDEPHSEVSAGTFGMSAIPHSPSASLSTSPSRTSTMNSVSYQTGGSSPHNPISKRLSFMSYSDLLTSAPAGLSSLSSLTTAASSTEPPPHIPSVSGATQAAVAQSQAGSTAGSAAASLFGGHGSSFGGHGASMEGMLLGAQQPATASSKRDSTLLFDDVGGEWEREGLGRGLEERLEALAGKE